MLPKLQGMIYFHNKIWNTELFFLILYTMTLYTSCHVAMYIPLPILVNLTYCDLCMSYDFYVSCVCMHLILLVLLYFFLLYFLTFNLILDEGPQLVVLIQLRNRYVYEAETLSLLVLTYRYPFK